MDICCAFGVHHGCADGQGFFYGPRCQEDPRLHRWRSRLPGDHRLLGSLDKHPPTSLASHSVSFVLHTKKGVGL